MRAVIIEIHAQTPRRDTAKEQRCVIKFTKIFRIR